MKLKHSPSPHRAEDAAWFISADTRQNAREADACLASDDWLYAPPSPPGRGKPQGTGFTTPPQTPAR
jgi:hypothetical protein